MRLGFFGGAFNPPSNIHISLAKDIIRNFNLDKLFFVPVGDYYTKNDLIPGVHRVKMLQLALADEPKMEAEEILTTQKERLYAIDAFKLLTKKYNKDELFFVMGSDNYRKVPTWKNYEQLLSDYNIIVIERERKELRQPIRKNNIYEFIPNNINETDSTKIREMIKNKESVNGFLKNNVLKYINDNKLYCN